MIRFKIQFKEHSLSLPLSLSLFLRL